MEGYKVKNIHFVFANEEEIPLDFLSDLKSCVIIIEYTIFVRFINYLFCLCKKKKKKVLLYLKNVEKKFFLAVRSLIINKDNQPTLTKFIWNMINFHYGLISFTQQEEIINHNFETIKFSLKSIIFNEICLMTNITFP